MNLEYDFNEIKEYSSVYDRNPGMIIPFFIGTIVIFIVVFLTMIFTIDKEYVVTTQGNIQSEDTADILFPSSGKVNKVYFKEGDSVRKDDIIFEIDDSYYKSQIDSINADHEIDLRNEELYLKEKDCVNKGINDFDVNDKDEAPFYYRMEIYLQSIYNLNNSKTNSDSQKSIIKNNALSEVSNDLENAKNEIEIINDQISSLTDSSNSSTYAALQNLVNQSNLKQRQIDLINLKIQSINESKNLFDENKDDEKSYYYSMETYLVQYKSQDNNGSNVDDINAQIEKLRNDMLIDINTNLKDIADKKSDYDVKLSGLQNQANNLKVKSPQNGYIHYVIPVVEGITVDVSKVYAKINGVDANLANMVTMIPATFIKNISIDCNVKVSFDLQGGYNKKYISGKIISIDSDTTTDVMLNQSFYKAYIKLDENIENPRTNMPAEVKIIYDKKKWVDYIMEMLSFKSKK